MDNEIMLKAEDGSQKKAVVLFTYHSEETNSTYMVYQVEGEKEVCACKVDEESSSLYPIETEYEWQMLEEIFMKWQEDNNFASCGSCSGCSGSCDCSGDCSGCGEE